MIICSVNPREWCVFQVWNARTHAFDIDADKIPCTNTQPVPDGSECVFNSGLAEAQNYRRISKQTAGAPGAFCVIATIS
jgi:hypothetical protein